MSHRAEIVGRVAAEVTLRELRQADTGGPAFVRLVGFEPLEAAPLLARLKGERLPGRDRDLEAVVAASSPVPGVPSALLLHRTLTWHRNHSASGLVIVQLERMSDQQGLNQMFVVSDGNVLDIEHYRSIDRVDEHLRLVVETTWNHLTSSVRMPVPQGLFDETRNVFHQLNSLDAISLRKWVSFVLACSQPLVGLGRAISVVQVETAVAEALPGLNLFPDEYLFSADPAAVRRRLTRNHHVSDLRTPSGKEIDEEDLLRRIEATELKDTEGEPMSEAESALLKVAMRQVVDGGGQQARQQIPLRVWEQLFLTESEAAGLGTAVRQHLDEHHPERVDEYIDIDVQDGLDEGEEESADSFMRAEPPAGRSALLSLLPPRLRKRIERLAIPRLATQSDPLRAVLYGVLSAEAPVPGQTHTIRLERDHLGDEGRLSVSLFAFLYGPTLTDVVETSRDGAGHGFEIDATLTAVGPLREDSPRLDGNDDVAFEDAPDPWAPLRLVMRFDSQRSPLYRFQWRPTDIPGHVAFARLIQESEHPDPLVLDSLEAFGDLALSPESELPRPIAVADPTSNLLDEWASSRRGAFASWATQGLRHDGIQEYLDAWTSMAERARAEFIPESSPLVPLDQFLDWETAQTSEGRLVMLATHPLRLRWLGRHLDNMQQNLAAALDGELQLNEENDQLYFDWIDRVSPHRHPPFLSGRDFLLATSAREWGLHEEYAPIQRGGSQTRDWLSAVDDASIAEMAGAVRSYLNAFPHKEDGIAILILARDGDVKFAERFLRYMRQGHHAEAVVELHIMAPSSTHERIFARLAEFDTDSERQRLIMPTFQLVLHSWDDPDMDPVLDELVDRIDVALAPNLFGTNTSVQPNTRGNEQGRGGRYDAWLDSTTHTAGSRRTDGAVNISRVLLPKEPDPLLETWSTLGVRRFRNAPVAEEQSDNTDYLTLQVRFDQNRELFLRLHRVAHWVVTLDPFVGRDQIDALEERPDIIVVKEGVGKNEIYTMVVSSDSGRYFVTERLARKIAFDLAFEESAEAALPIARRLHKIGRNVAPSVMLRALGLGRSTEEIIGLIVARFAVQCLFPPASSTNALEWWLSLDDTVAWFGGPHKTRADLLRVIAVEEEDGFVLHLHAVESKFRKQEELGTADDQLRATLALLGDAFGRPDDGGKRFADRRFWVRELVAALEQTSKRQASAADLPALVWLNEKDRPTVAALRSALLLGNYRVDTLEGIACVTGYEATGYGRTTTTPDGHHLVQLRRDELREILDSLQSELSPHQSTLLSGPSAQVAVANAVDGVDASPDSPRNRTEDQEDPSVSLEPAASSPRASFDGRSELGVSEAELESRYQETLNVFAAHKVKVKQPDGVRFDQGPSFVLMRVVPETGVATDRLTNRVDDLKLALGLPADLNIRSYVDRGAIVFEVPKLDEDRYPVRAVDLWRRARWPERALYAPIGEDIEGNVVGIDFSSPDTPHLLIAGTTGSGKSVALETLLQGMCQAYSPNQLRLYLIDPKGTELVGFEDDAHLAQPVGMDADDAAAVLAKAVLEMQQRYGLMKDARVKNIAEYNSTRDVEERLAWQVIVLDEYADLTSAPDDQKQIESSLKRLAQKARAAGIHMIVATQKPSAQVISTTVRSNLPAQLALRVKTASDSRIIMDESGAETLAGKGDAFLRTQRGLVRVQCGIVESPGDSTDPG